MKYKINYTIWECEDSIIIEADTIEELRVIAKDEMDKRNIPLSETWSEKID